MKYFIKCCGRIVNVDNKPIWCIKCGKHDIEVVEYTEDTMLPCPFCGGQVDSKNTALAVRLVGVYYRRHSRL